MTTEIKAIKRLYAAGIGPRGTVRPRLIKICKNRWTNAQNVR
jgi:hypothetical protein